MRYIIAILLLTVGASAQNYIAATTNPVPMYDTRYTMGAWYTNSVAWYPTPINGSNAVGYFYGDYSRNKSLVSQTNPAARPVYANRALAFAGGQSLTGNVAAAQVPLTLAANIFCPAALGSAQAIMSLGNPTSSTPFAYILVDTSGKPQYSLRDQASTFIAFSGPTAITGAAHHIVGTSVSTNDHRLYVDGVLVALTNTALGTFGPTVNRICLGAFARSTISSPYTGTGCCFVALNRGLTATEVTNLYRTTIGHP